MSTMCNDLARANARVENPENNSSTKYCRCCNQSGKFSVGDEVSTCTLCVKEEVWVRRSLLKNRNVSYSDENIKYKFTKFLRWAELNGTGFQAKLLFKELILLNHSCLLSNSLENCYVSQKTVIFSMMFRRVKNKENELDERNAWDRIVPNLVRYQIFSFLSIADATRGIEPEEIEKWADNVLKLKKSRRKDEKHNEWLRRPGTCLCHCNYCCRC